ncbi:MAG: peptide chain release factor N(5)-glutamine methyltransferase [Rhodobacteraceae bacterium]|nr:peptide chain release factor N(5)-glutamine methyltransferase [Paracoccaceae bacterium]
MTQTFAEVARQVAQDLAKAGIDDNIREAHMLMAQVVGAGASGPPPAAEAHIAPAQALRIKDLAARRQKREPMAYILGRRFFFDHAFVVSRDTLDPRPETETLVREALSGPTRQVLDLGTGCGAIALSVLAARPDATAVASDISAAALNIACLNAQRLGVEARLTLVQSDWFTNIRGCFDTILCNPPYIAHANIAQLAPELAHEPLLALSGGADGLRAFRLIAKKVVPFLQPGGRLVLEVGWQQAQDVKGIFADHGLRILRVVPDLDGRDRVLSLQNPIDKPAPAG